MRRRRNPWLYGLTVSAVIGASVVGVDLIFTNDIDLKKYLAIVVSVLVVGTVYFGLVEKYTQKGKNNKK